MDTRKVTTTITRTVQVDLAYEEVERLVREACGAPKTAQIDLSEYGTTTVTWSTVEADD